VVSGPEAELTVEVVVAALRDVKDPEIPVVSVVDLGIVQSVGISGKEVSVAITPTFTGCPALEVMRAEIASRILELGATRVDVPVVLDPPWSTDRISAEGRLGMATIGIAPPEPVGPDDSALPPHLRYRSDDALALTPTVAPVTCPWCGSTETRRESAFGPTICRAVHYCASCRQSFEQFKSL
jgi:ring-1,2-phenylacetyl-CoA epoxidase subunit PaaD